MTENEKRERQLFNEAFSGTLLCWKICPEFCEKQRRGDDPAPTPEEKIECMWSQLEQAEKKIKTDELDFTRWEDVKLAICVFVDEVMNLIPGQQDSSLIYRVAHRNKQANYRPKPDEITRIFYHIVLDGHLNPAENELAKLGERFPVLEIYFLCLLFGYKGTKSEEDYQAYLSRLRGVLEKGKIPDSKKKLCESPFESVSPEAELEKIIGPLPRWRKPKPLR